jgi:pimeloyl-ACP methyl ester carboxylesterase
VGHSGGAAIAAALLGMKPKLADAAVLVACPCELVRWRANTRPWTLSENPIRWADKVSPATKVIALTGSEDTNTFPALAESYVEALKAHGVDALFQLVSDSNHSSVIETSAVTEAIARLIR